MEVKNRLSHKKQEVASEKEIVKYLSVTEASLSLSHGTYTNTSPLSNRRK